MITRKDVERALRKETRPVKFEVRYHGRDVPVTYAHLDQINFDAVRKITLVFPEAGSPWIQVGNGDAAVKNRKKVYASKERSP